METQTQKQKEDEKKKAGLLANLLSGPGGRAAGGWGWLGRAGLGGGLLATKAGLIGLIMAGTTVAGGLGWLGYRLFGPSDADRVGASYSLFSPRPKEAARAQSGSGGGDQSSQSGQSSLDQLKAANASASGADQAAADQAAAAQAATAQQAAAAQAAAQKTADNKGNVLGDQAAKLKSDAKIGELSKMPGAAGGAGSAASLSNHDLLASARPLSGLSSSVKSPGAAARASISRALGALNQAGNARSQNTAQGANTYSGGGQYDGSAVSPIGGAGQSVGGAGAGGNPAGGNTSSNGPTPSQGPLNQFPAPPTPTGNNVTPWQTALDLAVGLVALAAIVLMFGKRIAKEMGGADPMVIYALAAIVAAIGISVMVLGHMIGSGQFGQTYQGGMFVAAGAMLMVGGAAMMLSQYDSVGNGKSPGILSGSPMSSTMNLVMMLSGASALGLAMMGFLKPMAAYNQSTFPNGAPDIGYYRAPAGDGQEYVVLGDSHGSDSRNS